MDARYIGRFGLELFRTKRSDVSHVYFLSSLTRRCSYAFPYRVHIIMIRLCLLQSNLATGRRS